MSELFFACFGLMRLVERLERRFARLKGADSAIDFDNSGGE
jgi:hypothetical protein